MLRSTALVAATLALTAVTAFDLVEGAAGVLGANARATTVQGPANEVWLAVNPTDSLNWVAVAKDYTLGANRACSAHNVWTGVYATHDGGSTWTNSLAPGHPGDPGQVLSAFACSSDPVAAFASDGTLYVSGLALGSDTAVWVASSKDGGNTLDNVALAARAGSLDKNQIGVDPVSGVVYVTYIDFSDGASIKTATGLPLPDGTLKWLPPLKAGQTATTTGSSPAVSVLPGGLVALTWINGAGGSQIFEATAPPLAQAFGPPLSVATFNGVGGISNAQYRTVTLPTAAAGPDGTVYVAWHARGAQGDSDVFVSHSGPMASSPWTAPKKVSQDSGNHDQWAGTVAVSPDGKHVIVGYYDRRDDAANKLLTAYASVSADDGATWTDVKMGDVAFNGDFGYHQNGFSFIGDYVGVAATNADFGMAWGDARNFASARTGSDVYFARALY